MSTSRRPWWLAFDRPSHAWWFLVFVAYLGLTTVLPAGQSLTWWGIGLGLLSGLAMAALSVVTLIAYRRHPDWVGRTWAPRPMARRRLRAFAAGTFVCMAVAIGAGIVAAATASPVAIAVAAVGAVGVLVCASSVAAHDDVSSATADR